MMHQVDGSIVDADLILLVTDIHEEYNEQDVLKNWKALQPAGCIGEQDRPKRRRRSKRESRLLAGKTKS
jgi:hypothetical protein